MVLCLWSQVEGVKFEFFLISDGRCQMGPKLSVNIIITLSNNDLSNRYAIK